MSRFTQHVLAVSVLAIAPLATPANATIIEFDVAGILSIETLGSPLNEVRFIDIGPFAEVIGRGYEVTLFAQTPSLLTDFTVYASDSAAQKGIFIFFTADLFPGTGTYSSNGIADLEQFSFSLGADGLLRLEFFELFSDFPGEADGFYREGQLRFRIRPGGAPVIPEPATWAMMIAGFGMVGCALRNRRGNLGMAARRRRNLVAA
jgi:hypothetical protein